MVNVVLPLVLVCFGAFFLYTGIVSFRRPDSFAHLLSLHVPDASGRVEIRAQYGGFFIASALSQFAPFVDLLSWSSALIVALVIYGGLFGGRIAALFVHARRERLSPMIRNLYVIDGLGFVTAAGCLFLVR